MDPTRSGLHCNAHGVLTIGQSATVAQAARAMSAHHVGALVVTDDEGRAVGIVSERDILDCVAALGQPAPDATVGTIMSDTLVSCTMATAYPEARRLMAEHGIRHLPILENGRPVGILSIRDVLAYELARARNQSSLAQAGV